MGIAVLIWQSIIFFTIALSGRLRILVTLFWIVWTLVQIYALPLSIVQFLTVFISYSLFAKKKNVSSSKNEHKVVPQRSIQPSNQPNKYDIQKVVDNWIAQTSSVTSQQRWLPKSFASYVIKKYPEPSLLGYQWHQFTGDKSPLVTLLRLFKIHNQAYFLSQKTICKPFFDTIENNPLTPEQIHACICMDDSIMIVAAAGSGKTSTMVAKTGYVLHENLAKPEQILLLSFNKATAEEVGLRIASRLKSVPNIEQVKSKTFHAFGIEVIGHATGKTPSLAPWVDPSKPGIDIREMMSIIQSLCELDAEFKRTWDIFHIIYARDIGKWGQAETPDAYANGKRGFLTAKGDIVKSKEERIISDWLFYHNINYLYEKPYQIDTADEDYRQYNPDFYYPDIQLYHEHFALNAEGKAPPHFKNYIEGVKWKRKIHAENHTNLIETTSDEIHTGKALKKLEAALIARGLRPVFDAKKAAVGLEPVRQQDLARSFRVFQQHAKNNGLSQTDLNQALAVQSEDGFAYRLRMYLFLYEKIAAEWERRLHVGHYIDFEDMLIQAAEHVESGRYQSPYSIILADEFQDSSRARIRLLKALATKDSPDKPHLCVVGDDWQGINRFAGSDIKVMTEFDHIFDYPTSLTLNTTFRCPQGLCDISSHFIQANPAQIKKVVKTTNTLKKTPLLIYGYNHETSMLHHMEEQLILMYQLTKAGRLTPTTGDHITVMILGRYQNDEPVELHEWQSRFGEYLSISFKTVHSSKGLEAEYIYIMNVNQGTRGFPSQIQDDPALQLAMPAPDPYPFSEERRCFYVALTRARKQVRIYTQANQPSQFLLELIQQEQLHIEVIDGDQIHTCPECSTGVLTQRKGRNGLFYGCSRFPACNYTCSEPPDAK